MAKAKDQQLYESVKKNVKNEIKKHSVYRSIQIVKRYKNAYEKKYGNRYAYEGIIKPIGLDRWFKSEVKKN